MASLFISYASADKTFARRLAASMTLLGHTVWIDQQEIGIGDSPWSKVEAGIEQAEYLIVVLSKHTLASAWVEREIQVKYCDEIAQRRTLILPVVIEDCPLPPFLRVKRFADFRVGYEIGLAQLTTTLHTQESQVPQPSPDAHSDPPEAVVTATSPRDDFWYTDYTMRVAPHFTEVSVEIGLPYIGKITGLWKPDEKEQQAAWEIYVELVTRVGVAGLQPDEGLLRESLSSLHVIFTTTRDILRKSGPAIARPKSDGNLSLGTLTIHLLNFALRPVLAKWHPLLKDWEHTRDPSVSELQHERNWARTAELRQALHDTRHILQEYTTLLAQVAGIPPLVVMNEEECTEHAHEALPSEKIGTS
jgi:hypothetical protein